MAFFHVKIALKSIKKLLNPLIFVMEVLKNGVNGVPEKITGVLFVCLVFSVLSLWLCTNEPKCTKNRVLVSMLFLYCFYGKSQCSRRSQVI